MLQSLRPTGLFSVPITGLLAGLSVVLIWSGWIVFSRSGLQHQLTASDITLLRFGTAALVTLPLALRYKWSSVSFSRALVIALGCGFPYTMLSFWGMDLNAAANAGVIVNGSLPIIAAVMSVLWLKAKVSNALWVVIVAMIISNSLLFIGAVDDWQVDIFGLILLFSAAVLLSIYMIAIKHWTVDLSDIIVWVPSINAVLFLPIWLIMPSNLMEAKPSDIAFQMAYQGIVVSLLALLLFSFSVKRLGVVNSSLFMAFVPVVTAMLSVPILKEFPEPIQWFGIVLCTLVLAWYVLQQPKK